MGGGGVEELLLDREVRRQVARELRQERRADAGAPALDGFAELFQVAVLTLEQCRGFQRFPRTPIRRTTGRTIKGRTILSTVALDRNPRRGDFLLACLRVFPSRFPLAS